MSFIKNLSDLNPIERFFLFSLFYYYNVPFRFMILLTKLQYCWQFFSNDKSYFRVKFQKNEEYRNSL